MTIEVENIREWIGRDVIDCDGEKVGELADVYFDFEEKDRECPRASSRKVSG